MIIKSRKEKKKKNMIKLLVLCKKKVADLSNHQCLYQRNSYCDYYFTLSLLHIKITIYVSLWWSSGIYQKKNDVDQQCTNKQFFIVLQSKVFHFVKFMKNETKEIQRMIKQSTGSKQAMNW